MKIVLKKKQNLVVILSGKIVNVFEMVKERAISKVKSMKERGKNSE